MKIAKRLIGKDSPEYDVIGSHISSSDSVVGIDAKHTHIIIINKLIELEEKLDKLSKKLKNKQAGRKKKR